MSHRRHYGRLLSMILIFAVAQMSSHAQERRADASAKPEVSARVLKIDGFYWLEVTMINPSIQLMEVQRQPTSFRVRDKETDEIKLLHRFTHADSQKATLLAHEGHIKRLRMNDEPMPKGRYVVEFTFGRLIKDSTLPRPEFQVE